MFKVQFEIIHKTCWGSEISNKFPEIKFSSVDVRWVKGNVAHILVADIIKAEGDIRKFEEIIQYLKIRKDIKVVETISKENHRIHLRTLTKHSPKHQQFSDLFFDNSLFMTAPVKFEKGYEKWTLATTQKKNIERVYTKLKRKYPIKIVYLKEEIIGENLTSKQRKALAFAKLFGYYEWPRKKGVTEIAKLLKTPKTVFLSHLRKAEQKIINKYFE